MSEVAKQTLMQVSETMFPGITTSYQRAKAPELRLGNEIVSNLPLQVCLFLNVIYFPFWVVIALTITWIKYEFLNYLYKFILVTVLAGTIIIELARLYLGYLGNLTEKVSFKRPYLTESLLKLWPCEKSNRNLKENAKYAKNREVVV